MKKIDFSVKKVGKCSQILSQNHYAAKPCFKKSSALLVFIGSWYLKNYEIMKLFIWYMVPIWNWFLSYFSGNIAIFLVLNFETVDLLNQTLYAQTRKMRQNKCFCMIVFFYYKAYNNGVFILWNKVLAFNYFFLFQLI